MGRCKIILRNLAGGTKPVFAFICKLFKGSVTFIYKHKKAIWYAALLASSSAFLWQHRNDFWKFDVINSVNLIFLIWIVLLLLPLFSEMEFLG